MIDTLNTAEIRARADAVQQGPFEVWMHGENAGWDVVYRAGPIGYSILCIVNEMPLAAFIAAARADVPALCDEVDRLRAALETKKAALREVEWVWTGYGSSCPWCYREKSRGHAGDCSRKAALTQEPKE